MPLDHPVIDLPGCAVFVPENLAKLNPDKLKINFITDP